MELIQGEVTKIPAGAIVNTANPSLPEFTKRYLSHSQEPFNCS